MTVCKRPYIHMEVKFSVTQFCFVPHCDRLSQYNTIGTPEGTLLKDAYLVKMRHVSAVRHPEGSSCTGTEDP